jgi:hypothetical protein
MPIPCACMVHTVRLAMKVLTDMGLAPSMKEACLFLSRPSLNHHISLVQIESQSGAMVCYKIEPYVCGATQTTYAVHEASNCLDTDWLYWESATPTSTSTPISTCTGATWLPTTNADTTTNQVVLQHVFGVLSSRGSTPTDTDRTRVLSIAHITRRPEQFIDN